MATGAIGLVIFDCDGVLVDSEPLSIAVLLETIARAGVDLDVSVVYDQFLGRSLTTVRDVLQRDYGVRLEPEDLAWMRRRLKDVFTERLTPISGIVETLDTLSIDYCVASSSDPQRIELSLGLTGLLTRLQNRIFSATMVQNGKPAPDLFLHAARAMGHAPAACLVIEDSAPGLQAAHAAGMRSVAFTGGAHTSRPSYCQQLAALKPDFALSDMRDLPPLLAEANSPLS